MLRIYTRETWAGHYEIYFVVRRWRSWMKKFNERFSRADRWLELGIVDCETFKELRDFLDKMNR